MKSLSTKSLVIALATLSLILSACADRDKKAKVKNSATTSHVMSEDTKTKSADVSNVVEEFIDQLNHDGSKDKFNIVKANISAASAEIKQSSVTLDLLVNSDGELVPRSYTVDYSDVGNVHFSEDGFAKMTQTEPSVIRESRGKNRGTKELQVEVKAISSDSGLAGLA